LIYYSTKIHALVDALGHPLKFILTPGQRNDITQASTLLQGLEHAHSIADKGYDCNALLEQIQEQNCIPVIPTRSHRKIPLE
jgi:transposase